VRIDDLVPAREQMRDPVLADAGAHPGAQYLAVRAMVGHDVAGLTPARTTPQGDDPRAGVGVLDPAGSLRTLRIAGASPTSGTNPGEPRATS